MSIQNDNTLVTKGDLKSLYTDKIAPYLGGGINYYYTDKTGEELKIGEYSLSGSLPSSTSQDTKINISKKSYGGEEKRADFLLDNNTIVIPEGMTVKITSYMYLTPGGSTNEVNVEFKFKDYANNIDLDYSTASYFGSGYSRAGTWSTIYTAPTGGAKIGLRCVYSGSTKTIHAESRIIVEEIGRIVDPVKYVSNNSDLQETPVGNIISYMGNSVPKHYLACDGTTYPIGAYPELEAFIIDEFGSINYFGGDGSTTWAVPDLRGEFLRGTGTNGHTNQGNGGDVGEHQDGTKQINFRQNSLGTLVVGSNSTDTLVDNTDSRFSSSIKKYFSAAGNSSDSEYLYYTARPTNTSVKYCIKYESTFHAFFSNAAYKVSATFDMTWNSTDDYLVSSLNVTSGDSSMVDGGFFKAPLDGWYNVSFNSGQMTNKANQIVQYIQVFRDNERIDYTDGSDSCSATGWYGISVNKTIYLNKGEKIRLRLFTSHVQQTLPTNRHANFCLLTSNYNPTIVSADTVYSENEQMIGYWKDGKPLYQKTISATSQPNINTWGNGYEIDASVDTIVKVSGRLVLNNNAGTYTGNFVLPTVNNDDSIIYIGTNNNHSSLPNRVGVKVGRVEYTSRPISITVQYTKTTDTASSLQIENSLLLNRPDLWTEGQEYHFGGGLYGTRFAGTVSSGVTAGSNVWTQIANRGIGLSSAPKVNNYGGWLEFETSGTRSTTPVNSPRSWQLEVSVYFATGGGFRIQALSPKDPTDTSGSHSASAMAIPSNAKYDVWVTYTK